MRCSSSYEFQLIVALRQNSDTRATCKMHFEYKNYSIKFVKHHRLIVGNKKNRDLQNASFTNKLFSSALVNFKGDRTNAYGNVY